MKEDTKTSTTLGRLGKAAAIGGILLAATACTAVEEFIISEELDGMSWRAVSIDGVSIPQDVEVTMNFAADSSVSGLAGCNNYRVQNVRTEGGVAFTQLAASRKLCQEPQMSTCPFFVFWIRVWRPPRPVSSSCLEDWSGCPEDEGRGIQQA